MHSLDPIETKQEESRVAEQYVLISIISMLYYIQCRILVSAEVFDNRYYCVQRAHSALSGEKLLC